MCGIVGYVSNREIDINKMVKSILHRGPDYCGVYRDNGLALGHSRLSIIDISKAGNQPMISKSGKYIIVYNGEIYNFKDIRMQLIEEGCVFKSNSDTEVILEGIEKWGLDLIARLNGIFAFAVYDKEYKKIYLARDRFGVKPLYYYHKNGEFIFSSEIKGLLASERINRILNYQGLHEYLHFGSTLGETTFYKGIYKLKPGSIMSFDIEHNKYNINCFNLNYDINDSSDSFDSAVEKIKYLLDKSVKSQLISDVPVGIFLSGGIDSAAITAFASKHYSKKLKTYSAGFDFDKGVNELPKAKYISNLFDTDHCEMHIKGVDIPDHLNKLISCFDQPFGDPANIPLYLMSMELKGKQKVVLQGDGGDELFAGYSRYFWSNNMVKFKLLSKIITKLGKIIPKSSRYYRSMRSMYSVVQRDPEIVSALLLSQEMFTEPPIRLFEEHVSNNLKNIDPYMRYRNLHNIFKHKDFTQELLYTDINCLLPDVFLEKVDRSTMAASIESRVPFLDNNLAHYAMSLPSKYKIRGTQKKYILKKALEGIVPNSILYGSKIGFGVPFQHWLRDSMANFMIDNIRSTNWFNKDVEFLMQQHIQRKKDNGYILWKLLNLSIWINQNPELDY